ncbi:MAG: hypothetical protein IT368_02845 [Candidatus Hydrogenedentes bacterium]|nr:hypothetical protein [Candidatus Hydrogenedentota bacterium]
MFTSPSTRLRADRLLMVTAAAALCMLTTAWAQPLVTPMLQYQGRILDPGDRTPIEGAVTVTFNIYDSEGALLPLWTETETLSLVDGLFSTVLGDTTAMPAGIFDGGPLWIGIQVDPDPEAVPRQPLVPVAYALYANNAALLEGNTSAAFAPTSHEHAAEALTTGTLDNDRIPASIARVADVIGTVLAGDGAGSTLDADTVDGLDSSAFAATTHEHAAESVTSGVLDDARIPASIAREANVFLNVLDNDGAGSGLDADTVDGLDSSVFASSMHDHDGAYLSTSGPDTLIANDPGPALSIDQYGTGRGLTVTSVDTHGIHTTTQSTSNNTAGVYAVAGASSGLGFNSNSGVRGDSANGRGVIGASTNNHGVLGYSMTAAGISGQGATMGVEGLSWGTDSQGVRGSTSGGGNSYGVHGIASTAGGTGVFGETQGTTGTRVGVLGKSPSTGGIGVYGEATATTGSATGVWGFTQSSSGRALYGESFSGSGTNYGAYCTHASTSGGAAVYGTSEGYVGVWGFSSGRWGVYGRSDGGTNAYGVYGTVASGSGNYAGYFSGNANVTGTLSKGGGSFKIDHPLDPENKFLAHSFVESPDMMNVYNGNVALDAAGEAWVDLPDWFEALNRDFRYQLTSIGGPGPNLYIAEEVTGNRFKIAGGTPGARVSWQVTGIRHDAFANANRIQVEEKKSETQKGHYLHPEAFGLKGVVSIGDMNSPEARGTAAR